MQRDKFCQLVFAHQLDQQATVWTGLALQSFKIIKKPVYVKKKKLSEQQNLRHSLFKKAKPALNERSECTGNIQNTVLSSRA
jgi:hypothetical protein